MSPTRSAPRDLRADLPATSRLPAVGIRRQHAWIDEDPDLTRRVPRRETPLTAFA